MSGLEQRAFAYCGREKWRPGLEPCCDRPEHADRLVCADVRGCVGAVLAQVHDGARVLATDDIRTVLDALDVAAEYKRDAADVCGDCDGYPHGDLCGTCEHRPRVADEYDALRERIGGQS